MRKPGTRQFVILVAEGSPLEDFYQEEAQRRGSSITKLLHDLINERFLVITGIIEQSSYWPGGRSGIALPRPNTKPSKEEKKTAVIETSEDAVLGTFGDMDLD
jgi:hypothetical protein